MAKVRRRGGIKRRGPNSWLISFFKRIDEKGKRHDFTETVKGTRKDAERRLQEKLREYDHGLLVGNSTRTLDEYFTDWLENYSKVRNSPRTAYGDEIIYNRYFKDSLGHKRLDRLIALDIQRVYAELQRKNKLSPQSIKHAHALIRKVLNHAVRMRVLPQNPALFVETPKVVRAERTVLDAVQAKSFIDACADEPLGLVFEFALLTGMRPEEYLAIKWKDMDFQRKTASVNRALVRIRKTWSFNEPKTKRSRRSIPLPDTLMKKIVIYKQKQEFRQIKAANLWNEHDLVFCNDFGLPLHITNLTYRNFRPILEKAGLPHIRLYDLRHSHATLLLSAEENPKVVSERLGHSTIVLTLDTYSHVLPTMQKRATDKLEQMIFG